MNETDSREGNIQWIPFAKLLLDAENPRLPERIRRQSQSEILRYLREQGVLEELARSYLDNGFFQHEPLIVVRGGADANYTVVEGNRRLAALKSRLPSPSSTQTRRSGAPIANPNPWEEP